MLVESERMRTDGVTNGGDGVEGMGSGRGDGVQVEGMGSEGMGSGLDLFQA